MGTNASGTNKLNSVGNNKFLFSNCADDEEEFPIKTTTTCTTQPQKPSWNESGHQNAKFDVLYLFNVNFTDHRPDINGQLSKDRMENLLHDIISYKELNNKPLSLSEKI